MPEYKKQHFIPRLLLRFFAINKERTLIGMFNPNTCVFKSSIPLEPQGQEDYFYGKDNGIEGLLGQVEAGTAPILAETIRQKATPQRNSIAFSWIYTFTMDLAYRTKAAADQLDGTIDNAAQHFLKYIPNLKPEDTEGLRVKLANAPAAALTTMWKNVSLAMDLSLKLIVNDSPKKFIISDNPVIQYNQFLEQKNHPGGRTVPLHKGFQMFLPISPEIMLFFYDKWAYEVGKGHDTVRITNPYDVDKLNSLQLINCSNAVYFGSDIPQEYLQKLLDKHLPTRNLAPSELKIATTEDNGKFYLQMYEENGNKTIKLNLSFIQPTKQALKYKLKKGLVAPFRNEEIRALLKHKKIDADIPKELIAQHWNPEAFEGINLRTGKLEK